MDNQLFFNYPFSIIHFQFFQMSYVVMLGQLFLSLSILIVLHEMGHFLPAKWFNTRVEKFYLFFDPWFSLFKVTRGGTEYGIGWLPLGGYVKIAGMIDESMDREQMKQPPKPWEFRSKPAWQRLIIMLGGVTVNFILGFFIWGMVLWNWGEQYLPAENATYGIAVDSLGREIGLQDGDKILQIGTVPFEKFNPGILRREIIINDAQTIEIERNGRQETLTVDPRFTDILSRHEYKNMRLFSIRYPFILDSVLVGKPAHEAGLRKGDKVVSINGVSTPFYHNYRKVAQKHKGNTVQLGVLRKGQNVTLSIPLSDQGYIDAIRKLPEMAREEYTLAEALPAGVAKGVNFLNVQIKAFAQMFRGKIKASESLGGFGSIAGMFGFDWHWERFWEMTAILSLILGFMNLLPIPALDGGHVMFLLYEMISGRKPSDKFMEYATITGFAILITLMLYANGLDVFRKWFS